MDKPWKVIVAFVGIFMAGAVFGGFFTLRASNKRYAHEQALARAAVPPTAQLAQPKQRPNPITPQLMRQFTRRLPDLTADQKRRITPHVERAAEDYQRLRQNYYADTQRVTERMYADVSEILTPEQRSEIEKMRRQIEERMQERIQAERQKKIDSMTPDGAGKEKQKSATRPPGDQ